MSFRLNPRRTARALLPLLLAALLLAACSAKLEDRKGTWTCPMHPEQISDGPGKCPVCRMDLVPRKGDRKVSGDSQTTANKGLGKTSEDLQASAEGITEKISDDSQTGAGTVRAPGAEVEAARSETAGRSIRATATVLADERRITQVHTRIAGWVEKLYVNATGQPVRRGQAMLEIHSPELVAAQEDFLRARAAQARFAGSSLPEVRQGAAELVAAARRRLSLLGVSEAEIGRLEISGQAKRTVRLDAPASGYVQEKQVFEGAQVEPGKALFQIVDLSRVWLEAAFPESDAASLRPGIEGMVTLPSDPSRRLRARATFVYPALDPATRSLKVRFEVANPGLALKPGMFADLEAVLAAAGASAVTVPASAVLDSGERRLVFVETAPGVFEPRRVETGPLAGGRVAVVSGLRAGERVAVRASFLVDSESRLPVATGGSGGSGDGEPVP